PSAPPSTPGSRTQTRLWVASDASSARADPVFFTAVQCLRGRFHEGQRLAVAGVPGLFRDQVQFVHPEFETIQDGREPKGEVLPRYPLTLEMSEAHVEHKFLQKIALEALDTFAFTDAIPEDRRRELGLLPEAGLLRALHKPATAEEIPALRRQLKIRELLPLSLRLETLKLERRKVGRAWPPSKELLSGLRRALPFSLTAGQEQAVEAITAGQAAMGQFCGLLMGDVG